MLAVRRGMAVDERPGYVPIVPEPEVRRPAGSGGAIPPPGPPGGPATPGGPAEPGRPGGPGRSVGRDPLWKAEQRPRVEGRLDPHQPVVVPPVVGALPAGQRRVDVVLVRL